MADPQFNSSNPALNPALAEYLSRRVDGKAMRRLRIERESLQASLRATGLAQPATVLNFNPVPLVLDGGLANFKVPSVIDKFVNDADRFRVRYAGREFKASIITIREPRLFAQIKDVRKEDDVEVGDYDMRACKQIEIAHAFQTSYTTGTESSSNMGGVIAFEGDRHVLDRAKLEELEVQVPTFVLLPNKAREYFTESKPLIELIKETLDMQKAYCAAQTQQAQAFWDNDEMRMNITDVHRIWHQYEIDHGWRQKEAPWVTLQHDPEEVCAGCGAPKKRVEAYFCSCGRPYDVLKAYLAGELPFESGHMARLSDGEWSKVAAEEKKRRARRDAIGGKQSKAEKTDNEGTDKQ